jgi:hypothetical protein
MEYVARSLTAEQAGALRFDADITATLRDAAESLQRSEMLAAQGFTVDQAMNAIELMDPKLDSGAHRPSIVPVAARIADGSLRLSSLSPPDVVRIMDKLLQLEVRAARARAGTGAAWRCCGPGVPCCGCRC